MSTIDQVKARLSECVRSELRDHAFGDAEVYWTLNDEEIASGYFGLDACEIYVDGLKLVGDEARQLRQCGTLGKVERNDAGRDA